MTQFDTSSSNTDKFDETALMAKRSKGLAASEEEIENLNASSGAPYEAARITSHRSFNEEQQQQISKVYSRTFSTKGALPTMGNGRPYPPMIDDAKAQEYIVEFDGEDDPAIPFNWPMGRKFRATAILVYPTFMSTLCSSIYAPATVELRPHFHVGTVVAQLGTTLYVLGFACGPILWGPMSEIYGRKVPIIISMICLMLFNFWCATADHYYMLMLYRFAAGTLGSAPLVVTAAALADLYAARARGTVMAIFSVMVMGAPMLAPIIGAFITYSHLHWRWCFYLAGILSASSVVLVIFFVEETYHPLVLAKKAVEIRERTGNKFIYAPQERVTPDFKAMATKVLLLPLKMLVLEPILLLTALYHGFIYGILYLCLSAVPIIFEGYGFEKGVLFLPYIGLLIGIICAGIINVFYFDKLYQKQLDASGKTVVPELRLPLLIFGSVLFPIGIFWTCWTGNYPEHVHWIVPTIGAGVLSCGLLSIFLPIFNYTIDTYLYLAASAMAANTFVRSTMGAAFPLFATAMFNNLGINWAGTLLGCLSILLIPVPIFFFYKGPQIRKKSKFAPSFD